jgi:hypothetical protein
LSVGGRLQGAAVNGPSFGDELPERWVDGRGGFAVRREGLVRMDVLTVGIMLVVDVTGGALVTVIMCGMVVLGDAGGRENALLNE